MAGSTYKVKEGAEPEGTEASEGTGPGLSTREKYLIYLVLGVVLLVIASAITLAESHSTPLSRCKGILLGNQRDVCLASLAVSSDNGSICTLMSSGAQQCAANVAEHYSNQSACDLISNGTYRYQCTLNVSLHEGSPAACATLGSYSSPCYYSFAKQDRFSNVTLCGLISNTTDGAYCNAVSDYNLAVSTGNLSYCAPVPNSADNNLLFLLLNYSASGVNDTNYLYYAYYNFTPRSYCYFNLALKYNNSAACNTIGGTIGSICDGALAERSSLVNSTQAFNLTSALLSCYAIPASLQTVCKTAAYTNAAVLYDNVSLCNSIQDQSDSYSCIDTVAQHYNDTSYCAYITNSTAQALCYAQ